MSNNLDRSLQEILATKPRGGSVGKRRSNRVSAGTRAGAAAAVAGGAASKQQPLGANFDGTSKVIVSNLPFDITDAQIKEYFSRTVAPIKSANLSYDKNGRSLGIATVVFKAKDGAEKAFKEYNSRPVDGKRKMKVEIVASQGNPLDSRIQGPPAYGLSCEQPPLTNRRQQAAATRRAAPGAVRGGARVGRREGRGARRVAAAPGTSARPAARPKKTAEELDQEMEDYFTSEK